MSIDNRNTPVRWGILGTARIATKVGRAIQLAAGAELVAIASRDVERAKNWVREHTVENLAEKSPPAVLPAQFLPAGASIRTYGHYDELLEDPEIDAVYIPLPPSLHCEWTIKAAAFGKHVLCEKPLALDADEADDMVQVCRERNVQLMDGQFWPHHERTAAMHEVIAAGTLGPLRRVTAAFSHNPQNYRPDNIRYQKQLGGGALLDLGWYCVRVALWAFDSLPERVFATARYRNDVDVNLSAMLWFPGERIATIDCAFDTAMRKWFEIAGTEGSIVCDDFVAPWDIEKARFWIHGGQGKADQQTFAGTIQEARMIERFSDFVRSGRLEDRWPREALETQRVCDAVAQSARGNQVVRVE
jgi:predicted dehydrogenase